MRIKFLLPCYFLLAFLCAISCDKPKKIEELSHAKKTILVSIAPYQSIVEKVTGDSFQVQTVVPPGFNPHAYEPTTKQVSALGEGMVWFRIGEPFEDKLLSVLKEKNPKLLAIDLREKIDLIPSEGSCCQCSHDLEDRHIWLSPKLTMIQVQTITNILAGKYPDSKNIFAENARVLIQDLEKLDQEIETILSDTKIKTFAVSHSAFAYFCKDYNLEQISIELGGKDPTLSYLTKIMEDIQKQNVKLGISMPQHSNKGLEIVAKKSSLQIHKVDPYSSDYFHTLRQLAHLIAESQ